MKTKAIEYRTLAFQSPASPSQRIKTDHYAEGYATTFSPYVLLEKNGVKIYERIDSRAFANADLSDVVMQYDHEGRVLARTTNGSLILKTDGHGLFVAADLGMTAAARDLHADISSGLITKMSWRFLVGEEFYDKATRTRVIKSIKKVYDVSAVSTPQNSFTSISARNQLTNGFSHKELISRKRQVLRIKHGIMMDEITLEER